MWTKWSTTNDTPFKSHKRCVGDGEMKLCVELGLPLSCIGGQNSTGDIIVPGGGKDISVKKYSGSTGGFCRLGAECQEETSKIIHKIQILATWCKKYSDNYVSQMIKKCIPDLERILYKGEISQSKVKQIDELINEVALIYGNSLKLAQCKAFKSDLLSASILTDILEGKSSLQDLLNHVARKEAIKKRLYLVHETLGYMEVCDPEMIWCPRITQNKPRVAIKDPYLCF